VARHEELRDEIDRVRSALNILETGMAGGDDTSEAARDLGLAVDNLRRSVWAVLTTKHSGDYDGFLGRIRLRRAREICEEVLAELYAGTITVDTPGLFLFHEALRDVMQIAGGGNHE